MAVFRGPVFSESEPSNVPLSTIELVGRVKRADRRIGTSHIPRDYFLAICFRSIASGPWIPHSIDTARFT